MQYNHPHRIRNRPNPNTNIIRICQTPRTHIIWKMCAPTTHRKIYRLPSSPPQVFFSGIALMAYFEFSDLESARRIISFFSWHLVMKHSLQVSLILHEKSCIWGLQPGLTQTGLYSHKRWLEAWNFGLRKKSDLFNSKNKGADQLYCYRAADLHLGFSYMQKAGFLKM